MFITAGLLTHIRYIIEFKAVSAAIIFWSIVVITSATVLTMKYYEDRIEKTKQGVYDVSWQDTISTENGPFAKVIRAAEELFSDTAVGLSTNERMASLSNSEQTERNYCIKSKSLHHRVEALRRESKKRAKTRVEVLQLLTTAAEELDALPDELTSRLNKILHDIDEADNRTANLVTMQQPKGMLVVGTSKSGSSRSGWNRMAHQTPRPKMTAATIDAQRLGVWLPSIRKKLGDISLTTTLRIKNLSDEPLRLKSGQHLKAGRYIQSMKANDKNGTPVCHFLYPITEIPPRTEVVIATRSNGGWVPTSGIEGDIVYTNRDETWSFRINFFNELLKSKRKCQVQALYKGDVDIASDDGGDGDGNNGSIRDQYWQISRDEVDRKANNEVIVTIDVTRGGEAVKARQSETALKAGFLLKKSALWIAFTVATTLVRPDSISAVLFL